MTEYLPFIERLGLPIALLLVVGAAIWRVARWSGPIVQGVVQKHVEAVDALERNSAKTADAIESLSRAVETQGEQTGKMLTRISEGIAVIGRAVSPDSTGVRELPADVRQMREEILRNKRPHQ